MKLLNLILIRKHFKEDYTIGNFFALGSFVENKSIKLISNDFVCNIIEDKFRGNDLSKTKVKDKTAIPEGFYETKLVYSERFKMWVPKLFNVPFFTDIEIHAGNTADDSSGCLVCGYNRIVGKVLDSKICLGKIVDEIKKYDLCYTTIKKEIL